MSVTTSGGPLVLRDRQWTRNDLAELPDNGHRYEIVDAVLVASGVPSVPHQRAVRRLLVLLDRSCPPEYEVFAAPTAVVLDLNTFLLPDVLVARVADLTEAELPAAPVLAVEVLSPGSHVIDLTLKPTRLARAGTPTYWVVDPDRDPAKARLRVWERGDDAAYHEIADVRGDDEYAAPVPYPVTVRPADLVR
jgi:Uma2 family endonuclease